MSGRAKKAFGQHFLEPAWVTKVVQAIAPQPADAFLEIGPGRGALTRPLLERVASIVAVEIDRDLAAALRDVDPKLTIVEGDFLDLADTIVDRRVPVRVAGNLPYNVASPILFKLAAWHSIGVPLRDATLMLQREVADRLIAPPGGKEYGVLSILMQYQAEVERLLTLPAGAFRPAPKVQSALVRVRFRTPPAPTRDFSTYERLVQAVFTRRRKTLANALLAFQPSSGAATMDIPQILKTADIDGRRRPETLTVAEYVRVADAYLSPSL